jgi:hypothetical protein
MRLPIVSRNSDGTEPQQFGFGLQQLVRVAAGLFERVLAPVDEVDAAAPDRARGAGRRAPVEAPLAAVLGEEAGPGRVLGEGRLGIGCADLVLLGGDRRGERKGGGDADSGGQPREAGEIRHVRIERLRVGANPKPGGESG